jgi:hypothetical protein
MALMSSQLLGLVETLEFSNIPKLDTSLPNLSMSAEVPITR